MELSDEKLAILQNFEAVILEVWRQNPEMTDYSALRAYEAGALFCRAEQRGHVPKTPDLRGTDAAAFEAVKSICEFRLGRKTLPGPDAGAVAPASLDLLIESLRTLAKSVERHTRAEGRQGYLTFLQRFMP